MTPYEKVLQLVNQMEFIDQLRLMKHLRTVLQRELPLEAYRHIPWEQFLDLTYGSLAHQPTERNQPFEPDQRDRID